jgi:hypothetical protein
MILIIVLREYFCEGPKHRLQDNIKNIKTNLVLFLCLIKHNALEMCEGKGI